MLAIILFVATGLGDWESLGPDGAYVGAMVVSPLDADIIYAALNDASNTSTRVLKTTDGGASWDMVAPMSYGTPHKMAVDVSNSDIVYCCCRAGYIYRTTDGGSSWTRVSLPAAGYWLEVDPFVPGRVYVAGYNFSDLARMALYISTDFGQTWTTSVADPTGTSYAYACATSPTDSGTVYIAGWHGRAYRSTDSGENWESIQGDLPTDIYIYSFAENPGNPSILVVGTSADGVYRSTDAGATWSETGSLRQVYHVEFSRVAPNVGYAGYDMMYVTTDSGATWSCPSPGLRYSNIKAVSAHPSEPGRAFVAGACGVCQTDDTGTTWIPIHHDVRLSTISTISVSPANPNHVYLEAHEQGVFKSTDRGDSWTKCGAFLSYGFICGIGILPGTDADTLFALEGKG